MNESGSQNAGDDCTIEIEHTFIDIQPMNL